MPNPILIATQGKGFLPMLERGRVIAGRYGLTSQKMDNALSEFVHTLSQTQSFATFPVTASALVSNPVLAKKYSEMGLELAIHGLRHIDYSQLSAEEQSSHVLQARGIFQKLGIRLAGFRCPYLRWNEGTLSALREAGFLYDSSQALSWDTAINRNPETYQHVLEFYRAQSADEYPALPSWSDGLVRIPYCLPDDEALVDRFHLTDPIEMAQVWLAILDSSYQLGELFTLGLHPERIYLCQGALSAVLQQARLFSPAVWIARLDEIARWYLALGQAAFSYDLQDEDHYAIKITAPEGASVLVRSLNVNAATLPWAAGYQSVAVHEFVAHSSKRPWIGLSPNTPASLQQFLRHQGFLTETSTDVQAYVWYLERSTFDREDERGLLAQIEHENFPLVRLSRWPNGARSALSITGDIDALTIWDYGKRIFAL